LVCQTTATVDQLRAVLIVTAVDPQAPERRGVAEDHRRRVVEVERAANGEHDRSSG
jgi:hypothetical protein